MTKEYVLKTNPLSPNRINKTLKLILAEAAEDRSLALECHKLFKDKVEENPQDSVSKSLMVECLKLAQNSKQSVLKTIDIVTRSEARKERATTKNKTKRDPENLYEELDNLTND